MTMFLFPSMVEKADSFSMFANAVCVLEDALFQECETHCPSHAA